MVSISFAIWRGRKQNQAPPVRIIAVLPFKPLILANRDESLELGMADTLIARLSRIHDLTVNPLSAVRKYGGQDQNPFSAGRELGVEAGFLEKATRKDPNYALAYAGLADCYERLPVSSDVRSHDAFPKAKQAALKALQIDSESFEAHASLGWIALWYDWDWKGSEHEFRQALEINPNYTFARAGYAHLLSDLSRTKRHLTR